ncbi:MarR family winged helix-turn-helix transcriptional regulator [Pseudochryseolinea flava]|uniref:HTH marR-type domain-containing protein n=1 Tax=Pseudochryseolinea flava TaxID=2059302 RepID=A0A364XYX4_9BACT|nr:MarR family winged helix-turn-helix transcriptional regulator [Pseudochryseolinea flava]RAV98795.1 hypothetical protein DQQ10_22530 [Pseudochryseolinea flava]
MSLDQKLRDTEYLRTHSWGKLITLLKRQFDHWATLKLTENGYDEFKTGYMPVLMNISLDGTNNNELAKLARVTKQAMSKVSRELIDLGFIKTKTDPTDKRSTIFILTEKGKKLVIEARLCVKDLMDEYRILIGAEDYDKTLQTLLRILEYTDQKLQREHHE